MKRRNTTKLVTIRLRLTMLTSLKATNITPPTMQRKLPRVTRNITGSKPGRPEHSRGNAHGDPALHPMRTRLVPGGSKVHGSLPKVQEHGLEEKEDAKEDAPLQTLRA